MSHSVPHSSSSSSKQRRRSVTVHIVPTLGVPFTLTCSHNMPIEKFKEEVSDRVGISPKKIALLLRSVELRSGSLVDNGVVEGSELRLIPCLESGVNTTVSTDPLAMMKHSMSSISDQQIDDFLAGKVPLSVAIRLGESVVVVNLNRAKVEDVDLEPPQEKRLSSSQRIRSNSSRASSQEKHASSSLNTNPHWSSSAACTSTSSVTTPPCSVPVRSVIPAGTPVPSADLTSSSPHIGGTIDEHHNLLIHGSTPLPSNRRRPRGDDTDSPSSSPIPTGPIPAHIPAPPTSSSPSTLPPSPLIDNPNTLSRTIKKARRSSLSKGTSSSGSCMSKSTACNKAQSSQSEWEELRRLREAPPTNNGGISMKRKAVMEAIGEILKKMYSQRSRGKSPGTFKGRFSSEFTCDNDMQEIIHSRTTMTSYGGGASSREPHTHSNSSRRSRHSGSSKNAQLTKARYEENEVTRSKVEVLKWKLQQQKILRTQKRRTKPYELSPVVNAPQEVVTGEGGVVDVDVPQEPPTKIRKKTGFGGFKRGFLLSD